MRLYHFTSMVHLPSIIEAGVLRTTESNGDIRPGHEHALPDVVWLLDVPTLDGLSHGLAGSAVDKTAVRFTVDVPRARVERWSDWAKRNKVDDLTRAVLVEAGGGWEAAKHWWITERAIPSRQWRAITHMPSGQPIAERA